MCANISIDFGQFLIKIWDATVVQLQYLGRPKPRIEQLKQARAGLRAKADDISNSISQAQREGQIPSNQIQQWKSEVEELEGKVAATEQDFERRHCLAGWSWNCFSVNRRVATRLDDINKLMTRTDAIPVVMKPPPSAVVQIPTSNSTFGMEAYMRESLCYIASANVAGVMGVYGMGGVGKTTLLNSINNHRDVGVFDHVIWAMVSKECNMERLQMDIAKRLKLHIEEDDSKEDRAGKLYDFLKNKDCLLLLDDLWAPLDLAKLGMAHATLEQGEQKRKIVVFTTRHEQVCSGMKADKKMEIKCLGPEQAWELFRRNVGEDVIGSDAGISRVAHLIAEECAGLPLALVTVGVAMSTKKSWEAWNDALTLMKHSQMPKVTGMKVVDPVFSAFKLSYDSLEDDDMRSCLLSCALWPEDHSIHKDKLIECWIGLGLINEVGAIHKAYNRGHSYIETLKAACLLEPGDKEGEEVKMHDAIRDMALWMASDCGMKKCKWIVRSGAASSLVLEEEGWHEAERVSLMYNDIKSIPNQLSTCSNLSVLILQHNNKLGEIRGTLIQAMQSLTYLDLESTEIKEIPKEIAMLSQLKHLNLSWTQIRELPPELSCLTKLNYLFLRNTFFLSVVSKGTIANLTSLRLLDLRGSNYDDWLDELEGLKGCHKFVSIDVKTTAALQRLCSLSHLSTWQLNLDGDSANRCQLLDDIMRSPNIRQSMEQLRISDAKMDELQISEMNKETGGFQCLKYLHLFGLLSLRDITWKAIQPQIIFPNIRMVKIAGCHKLTNVNWTLQLPSLNDLVISFCDIMEELISDEGISSSSSFGLRKMTLSCMRKLKRISPRPLYFPYLEKIVVIDCLLLKKLPFENRISVNRLKMIRCVQTWWDNLEWEEISIKYSLSPLVGRIKNEDLEFHNCELSFMKRWLRHKVEVLCHGADY